MESGICPQAMLPESSSVNRMLGLTTAVELLASGTEAMSVKADSAGSGVAQSSAASARL